MINIKIGGKMIVYRVCSRTELFKILDSRSLDNVGKCFEKNVKTLNNHKYEKDKKYLHFFEKKENIWNLKLHECDYICTYNIPDEILVSYYGIGYYYNIESVDFPVVEYAIPVELLNINNFICYESLSFDKSLNSRYKKRIKIK